jgi:predicted RNA binding protein YcfA (HicA-like mRNA interferase family)
VVLDSQTGSHTHFKHPIKLGKVTVPYHGGNQDLVKPIVQSILKQAGLK